MQPNPGRCPEEARGKRVRGILANGQRFGFEAITTTTPPGWAADGQHGCRWSLTGHPADIDQWEISK